MRGTTLEHNEPMTGSSPDTPKRGQVAEQLQELLLSLEELGRLDDKLTDRLAIVLAPHDPKPELRNTEADNFVGLACAVRELRYKVEAAVESRKTLLERIEL